MSWCSCVVFTSWPSSGAIGTHGVPPARPHASATGAKPGARGLSRKEFRRFTQSTVGANGGLSGLEERQHFDSIDANRDGSISSQEFLGSASHGEASSVVQEPEGAAAATIAHFDKVRDVHSPLLSAATLTASGLA